MPDIRICASISPTEDPERLRTAVLNLFPEADIHLEDGMLEGRTDSIEQFVQRILELRIRDSAIKCLRGSATGTGMRFSLNRQAAFMNRVNFAEDESALGEIDIIVDTNEPEDIVRMLEEGVGP